MNTERCFSSLRYCNAVATFSRLQTLPSIAAAPAATASLEEEKRAPPSEKKEIRMKTATPGLQLHRTSVDRSIDRLCFPTPDGKYEAEASLVARLLNGDIVAMAELHQLVDNGFRFSLALRVGFQDLEDSLHDAFIEVLRSIQRNELHDPRRLMGFIRIVIHRMGVSRRSRHAQDRHENVQLDESSVIREPRNNPEKNLIARQRENLIPVVLELMSSRDREVLNRFYVQEQTEKCICAEMKMSPVQFRLLKSRAKDRFGDLGRQKLHQPVFIDHGESSELTGSGGVA
jgi:RNA polymerase sigma-70 factor (ECF subfamily)